MTGKLRALWSRLWSTLKSGGRARLLPSREQQMTSFSGRDSERLDEEDRTGSQHVLLTAAQQELRPPATSPAWGGTCVSQQGHKLSQLLAACFAIAALLLVAAPTNAQPNGRTPRRVVPANAEQPGERVAERPELAPVPGAAAPAGAVVGLPGLGGLQPEQLVQPQSFSSTLNLFILLTVISLVPSILIMTTCFVRFVIVLGLLRQALGTQTLPPNQVLMSLCLFLTLLVMAPVWRQSYENGIRPYTQPAPGQAALSLPEAARRTAQPIQKFMGGQIERTGNSDLVWMFLEYQRPPEGSPGSRDFKPPETYEELGPDILLPAYMLSEMKAAFVIGFQIYLPFLVIDLVVAAVLMSMGMAMLPPSTVSVPFKLLLFVLIDGWGLTVGMLLESVRPFGG